MNVLVSSIWQSEQQLELLATEKDAAENSLPQAATMLACSLIRLIENKSGNSS
jgi:hypothetical protein